MQSLITLAIIAVLAKSSFCADPSYDIEDNDRFRPLSEIVLTLAAEGKKPPTVSRTDVPVYAQQRRKNSAPIEKTWEPSKLCNFPLYFEDVPLENYGQSRHHLIQPAVSGFRFLIDAAAIPYKTTLDPMCQSEYSLGLYRPGSPTPCVIQVLPWDLKAALVEAGAVVGLAFALP